MPWGGQQGAREDGRKLGEDPAASTQGLGRVKSSPPPGTPTVSVTQKPRPEAKVLQGGQR